MRRGAAHLTLVFGEPATAGQLRSALERHGVAHAAVVAHLGSIRRSLVLGENEFVVVCIAIDKPTIMRQGEELKGLLSDNHCFPTGLRTVGLLTDLGLTTAAAELGCDLYVDNSAEAAKAIRLLDDAWSQEEGGADAEPARRQWAIRSGWKFGTPQLPAELEPLLVPSGTTGTEDPGYGWESDSFSPRRIEGSGEDFGGLS